VGPFVKALRYLAAFAVVAAVFVAGGMAAASAQEASMQAAMAAQAQQQAQLQATVAKNIAGVQSASDRCDATNGACSSGQGVTFTILPPGVTPPPTTTPPPGGNGGVGGGGGKSGGGTKVKLPKTGPSAVGWTAIVGLLFIQVGLVVLVRGTRWTRHQLALL
jgi:LPXTG-motif cell wall-anchored protein